MGSFIWQAFKGGRKERRQRKWGGKEEEKTEAERNRKKLVERQ